MAGHAGEHLHGFAREARRTQEEWARAVVFPTETGHGRHPYRPAHTHLISSPFRHARFDLFLTPEPTA